MAYLFILFSPKIFFSFLHYFTNQLLLPHLLSPHIICPILALHSLRAKRHTWILNELGSGFAMRGEGSYLPPKEVFLHGNSTWGQIVSLFLLFQAYPDKWSTHRSCPPLLMNCTYWIGAIIWWASTGQYPACAWKADCTVTNKKPSLTSEG